MALSAGFGACEFWSWSTIIILLPSTVQISTQAFGAPLAAATACEIDGASDASRIAKHAIQVVHLCLAFVIRMARASRKKGNLDNHLVDGWRLIAADYSRASNESDSGGAINHVGYAHIYTPELRVIWMLD